MAQHGSAGQVQVLEADVVELGVGGQDQLGDAETTAVSKTDVTQKAAPQVTDSASTGAPESVKEMSLEKSQLLEKIQQLEARLVEYEIIAEDIAEVAQLKSENV